MAVIRPADGPDHENRRLIDVVSQPASRALSKRICVPLLAIYLLHGSPGVPTAAHTRRHPSPGRRDALRCSATEKSPSVVAMVARTRLRCLAALEGDRHADVPVLTPEATTVAIPGRPGRPPPWGSRPTGQADGSCDPRPPGGRPPRSQAGSGSPPPRSCDPWPPRRATATRSGCGARSRRCRRCDPRPPRRATATSDLGSVGPMNTCCDPRPPRKATATGRPGTSWTGRGCCDPRPPPEGDRHPVILPATDDDGAVAIPGRPGRRPPLGAGCQRHEGGAVAIPGRPGRRPPRWLASPDSLSVPSAKRSEWRHRCVSRTFFFRSDPRVARVLEVPKHCLRRRQ